MTQLGFEPYYDLPAIKKLSTLTKQPPFLILAAILLLFVILIFTPIGFLITSSLTFLFPAYQTFKALETKEDKDDKRMLTFWVCFGFLYLFDYFFSTLFSFLYFYHVFRAALILYLYLPRFDGATTLYAKVIQPLFQKYSSVINQFIVPMEEKSQKLSQNFKKSQ